LILFSDWKSPTLKEAQKMVSIYEKKIAKSLKKKNLILQRKKQKKYKTECKKKRASELRKINLEIEINRSCACYWSMFVDLYLNSN
jgi:hypothetical protein